MGWWPALIICGMVVGCRDNPPTPKAPPSEPVVKKAPESRPKVSAKFDWSKEIESDDYPTYIANLRRVKCPEATIRDIVVADLDALFVAKLREELKALAEGKEYWTFKGAQGKPALIRDELEQAKKEALVQLLRVDEAEAEKFAGIDLGGSVAKNVPAPAYIQPENQEQFEKVDRRLDQADKQLLTRARETGMPQSELQAAQRVLDAQRERHLARCLSPAELEAHMLRESGLAKHLQRQMLVFEPSAEEFKAIYSILRLNAGLSFTTASVIGDEERSASAELLGHLEQALTPDRLDALKSSMNPDQRNVQRFMAAKGFDEATARKAAEIAAKSRARALEIRSDSSLSDSERTKAIKRLQAEKQEAIRALRSGAAKGKNKGS